MRVVRAALAALVVMVGLASCQPARPTVIYYGDSLVWDSATEIRSWTAARGWDAILRTRFGGAPCSLFAEMREDRRRPPAVVVISFAGNGPYLAPCVGSDVPASYRAQMAEVERIWRGSGTRLVWVRVPLIPVPASEAAIDVMAAEAPKLGMRVLDGGRHISPGGVYAWTQPCMPGERCVGSQINSAVPPGRNIVRANDKVHLCPGPGKGFNPCPTYSSGAWRFARVLSEAVVG